MNVCNFLNSVCFCPGRETAIPFSSHDIKHPGLKAQLSSYNLGEMKDFSSHSFFSSLRLINLPLCNIVNVQKIVYPKYAPSCISYTVFPPTQTLTTYAHSFQLTTHTSAEGKRMCSGKHTCVYTYVYKRCQLDSPLWLFSS